MKKYVWSGHWVKYENIGSTRKPCGGVFETDEDPWVFMTRIWVNGNPVHEPRDVRIRDAETGNYVKTDNPWHRANAYPGDAPPVSKEVA